MADKNPGTKGDASVTRPNPDASPFDLALANSRNHGRAGQNVLYVDNHVGFESTPYCGVGGDNIYTALSPAPATTRPARPNANGVCGHQFSPAWPTDSYLVPTDDEVSGDQFPKPPRRPAPPSTTTSPATVPTTTPATTPTTLPATSASTQPLE